MVAALDLRLIWAKGCGWLAHARRQRPARRRCAPADQREREADDRTAIRINRSDRRWLQPGAVVDHEPIVAADRLVAALDAFAFDGGFHPADDLDEGAGRSCAHPARVGRGTNLRRDRRRAIDGTCPTGTATHPASPSTANAVCHALAMPLPQPQPATCTRIFAATLAAALSLAAKPRLLPL